MTKLDRDLLIFLAGALAAMFGVWLAYDPPIQHCYVRGDYAGGAHLYGVRAWASDAKLGRHASFDAAFAAARIFGCTVEAK